MRACAFGLRQSGLPETTHEGIERDGEFRDVDGGQGRPGAEAKRSRARDCQGNQGSGGKSVKLRRSWLSWAGWHQNVVSQIPNPKLQVPKKSQTENLKKISNPA